MPLFRGPPGDGSTSVLPPQGPTMPLPMPAGLSATTKPADFKLRSCRRRCLLPEMMAPAWPMRRPRGGNAGDHAGIGF